MTTSNILRAVVVGIVVGCPSFAMAQGMPYVVVGCSTADGRPVPCRDSPSGFRPVIRERREPPSPSPPRESTWSGLNGTLDRGQDAVNEARRNLEALNSLVERLDAQSRALFDMLSNDERASVADVMAAVKARLVEAVGKNQRLAQTIARLQVRVAAQRKELLELKAKERALLSETIALRNDIAALRAEIVVRQAQLAEATANLAMATELTQSSVSGARQARIEYWQRVGNLFTTLKLGEPRDYTPEIVPDDATVQRRVIRQEGVQLVPRSDYPVLARGTVALARSQPLAFAALASPVAKSVVAPDKERFLSLLEACAAAMNETAQLQARAEALIAVVEASGDEIHRQALALAESARARGQLDQARNSIAETAAAVAVSLQDTTARLQAQFERGWPATKAWAFWEVAQQSLDIILSAASGPTQAAAHLGAVLRSSYSQFLNVDFPQAVALGANPSTEAREKYDRYTELQTPIAADIALSLLSLGKGAPSFNAQKLKKAGTGVWDGVWESYGGVLYGPRRGRGRKNALAIDYNNEVQHLLIHTRDIPERDNIHSVFYAQGTDLIELVDEVKLMRPTKTSPDGRLKIWEVDLGRPIGFFGGQRGAELGHPIKSAVRLELDDTSFANIKLIDVPK